jgi:hypothetical protein
LFVPLKIQKTYDLDNIKPFFFSFLALLGEYTNTMFFFQQNFHLGRTKLMKKKKKRQKSKLNYNLPLIAWVYWPLD